MVSEVETTVSDDTAPEIVVEDPKEVFLRNAKVKEVLSHDSSHKTAAVLLENEKGEQGVLMLIKTAFSEDVQMLDTIAHSGKLKNITSNDRFGSYHLMVPSELNTLQTQFIYPTTEKLIAKYRFEEKFVINETPSDYQNITLPFIEKYQNDLQWVYNLLGKQAEVEKIIYEDPDPHNGFVLANDFKWDGKTVENLYVLAIIHRRNVKSVRDLTGDDLPMLENLREKCLQAIKENFGLRGDQMRVYFHYQPSFYHLHVHFVNLQYDAPASTTLSAILLDDVINNLTLMGDYYRKASLSFTRKKTDQLLHMFREAGRCQE